MFILCWFAIVVRNILVGCIADVGESIHCQDYTPAPMAKSEILSEYLTADGRSMIKGAAKCRGVSQALWWLGRIAGEVRASSQISTILATTTSRDNPPPLVLPFCIALSSGSDNPPVGFHSRTRLQLLVLYAQSFFTRASLRETESKELNAPAG
jgi:hypothetical protein